MLKKCRQYYRNNQTELNNINLFEQTYKSEMAIEWYTKETFVYKMINKALRTEDMTELYTFRLYISDLCHQLALKHKQQQHKEIIYLYRGFRLSTSETETLAANIGNIISLNGFISTSHVRDVAERFATSNYNQEGVLFEIEVDSNKIIFADIHEYSEYPEEREVLFDLGVTLKIHNVQRPSSNHPNSLWIFQMKTTEEGTNIAHDYINYEKRNLLNDQNNLLLVFGNLLLDMGYYRKALNLCATILLTGVDRPFILVNIIAQAQEHLGEWDEALINYKAIYEVLKDSNTPDRIRVAASMLNSIGNIYDSLQKYDLALENYFNGLEIMKNIVTSLTDTNEEQELSLFYTGIGNIYRSTKEYQKALEFHRQALDVNQRYLPEHHPLIGANYYNIGNVYLDNNQYDEALEYFRMSLKIRQQVLTADHLLIGQSCDVIGVVYFYTGSYELAIDYYQRALKIYEKIYACDDMQIKRMKYGIRLSIDKIQEEEEEQHRQLLDIFGMFNNETDDGQIERENH
ncbi:unnamed protein product [Didymodactylos carnosus]|nr:unnamed protein product [Didymodactylos carnosus]CAF4493735.1 unnamed protein product [Didymodactylos carnosus]